MSARVLVVDGVDAHREIIGSWLRRAGYQVVEAATGEEALAKVDPDLDVIVLDVDLPDMTGFDVCASVKADPATAGISVMHVSATAIDPHSRAQGLDMGRTPTSSNRWTRRSWWPLSARWHADGPNVARASAWCSSSAGSPRPRWG